MNWLFPTKIHAPSNNGGVFRKSSQGVSHFSGNAPELIYKYRLSCKTFATFSSNNAQHHIEKDFVSQYLQSCSA